MILKTKIVFLGTSAAVPTVERNLPAIAIIWKGEIILFDAGEGVQRQMMKAGLSILKVRKIFITHAHGDHVLGLPGLLHTMAMYNRRESLTIYSPKNVWNLISSTIKYTGHDPLFKVVYGGVGEGIIYENNEYLVRAFRVDHGEIEAYGYVFEEKKPLGKFDVEKALKLGIPKGPLWKLLQEGKNIVLDDGRIICWKEVVKPPKYRTKIVYTGDTRPIEKTIEISKNATILIHDSTFDSAMASEAHDQGHSTAYDAALIAKKAEVKLLILTHISARYKNVKPLIKDSVKVFDKSMVAKDFLSLWIF